MKPPLSNAHKIPVSSSPEMFTPSQKNEKVSLADAVSFANNTTMPTVSQVRKLRATHNTTKKPFDWRFLLPTYWGIWLVIGLFWLLSYLPLRWQFKLGKALGGFIYTIAKRRRLDTLINLRLTFAEHSEEEREAMAKMIFVNATVGVFESLSAWFHPDIFTRQVTISGLQHVVNAQQAGQSVIILGAHYTMLDLGGRLASMFIPVDVVYRPQNNPLLEWFIYNARTGIFNDQIGHRDMRHLAKNIKDGNIIWYTPDQDFGLKQGVMAKFFGIPAATVTAQRRLANLGKKQGDKANPPAVVMVHFYRETPVDMPMGKKPHYHIRFSPALTDYPSQDEHADALRVNHMLENFIRIDPTQYMWFHRRFKTQPSGVKYYR